MLNISQKIRSVTRNNDIKVVASNFIWLSALQVAGYIFPLITMPYLARTIGVDGFGKIAFAAAIMVWIQTIADWGFNLTATRDVAQNRDNKEKVSEIFSNVLWARILLMFVSLGILLILIAIIPKFRENWDIIMVTFLMIPGHILFPEWFFQAMEKMRYISILNVAIKLIFTISVFIFITKPEDYIIQPLLTAMGYAIGGIIALYIIIKQWKIQIKSPNWRDSILAIRNSTDVFINNIAPNLYNSLSVVLLGIFFGGTATGIYDGGNRFFTIISGILNSMTRAFFPFLSRKQDKHDSYVKIILLVSILAASAMYLTAPMFVNIMLSQEFSESVVVIRILSVSLIFYALSSAYGACYLIIQKREKVLRQITIICSILGLIIAIPLIHYYAYIGVALTVTITRILLGLTSMIISKSEIDTLFKLRK